MASAQTRIAETVALFYTADRTSDVRTPTTATLLGLINREQWLDMHTSPLSTS
jgi:hypothetical protein